MVELNPPLHLQNRTDHTAQGDRLLIRSVWRIGGLVQFGDLFTTAQGSPNMTLNVSAGAVIVLGSENGMQGSYHCVNDATKVVTITAADATFGRRDIIVAKVQDQAYSGATNAWSIAVVTGTPSGSPVPPAAPANSIVLATIVVNQNATSITNANITNANTVARSAISKWQLTDATDTYQWRNSAGTTLGELDATGHFKSVGTTGGATKVRKPMARMELASYLIPNSTVHKLLWTFDQVLVYDTDGMWNGTNNWLVINTAGIYTITLSVAFRYANTTGYRAAGLVRNNGTQVVRNGDDAPLTTGLAASRQVSITYPCSPGDTWHAVVWQNSGASLFIENAAVSGYSNMTFIQATWEAPLT